MPTYTFQNKETGEITEHVLKMSELDAFKEANAGLERYFCDTPPIGDPVRLGLRKTDQGWKETLQMIHKGQPGSVIKGNIR